MKQREQFISYLNKYYSHLNTRLIKGGEYIDNHKCTTDSKEYKAYESIIYELSQIESLINFYNKK